jgi:hypothetical protein
MNTDWRPNGPEYGAICLAIREACSNRLKPTHGSDIQDFLISLRHGPESEQYWCDPENMIEDMLRRGLLRRGMRMLREHQEVAQRASSWRFDSPFHYWYTAVGLDTTPCEDRETLLARLRLESDEP